ncbi:MAG: putative Na+/H+ antiporter [Vicinamibacterales bacterium]
MPPIEMFNVVATAIFALAVTHTFFTARFTAAAHHTQRRHDEQSAAAGRPSTPSFAAELLHFLGEVEVVFGLWTIPLLVAFIGFRGWHDGAVYFNNEVNYTEPLFVGVIMALASTRPIVSLAEAALRQLATLGGKTPAAWWITILIVGPLMGSFITEPGAMTISALLLARQFYDLQPSTRLKYATLGLLFVNVSIGGTLTHFAAPPVLMVARVWEWDTPFMLDHFGWRAASAIVLSTVVYYLAFFREFRALATLQAVPEVDQPSEDEPEHRVLPIPPWVTLIHVFFMAWTVATAHYPGLFVGGFLFFLGFSRTTAPYQSLLDLKTPLLVSFFLAGLVIHGGLQGWWIKPLISRLSEEPLFWGATLLTAFNDNALITYLATLVPDLGDHLKYAVVEGAVTGGGLTVIANAPNPAGQALLGRFFGFAINPLQLLAAAVVPTLIAAAAFRLF